jgi:hypothetical protein
VAHGQIATVSHTLPQLRPVVPPRRGKASGHNERCRGGARQGRVTVLTRRTGSARSQGRISVDSSSPSHGPAATVAEAAWQHGGNPFAPRGGERATWRRRRVRTDGRAPVVRAGGAHGDGARRFFFAVRCRADDPVGLHTVGLADAHTGYRILDSLRRKAAGRPCRTFGASGTGDVIRRAGVFRTSPTLDVSTRGLPAAAIKGGSCRGATRTGDMRRVRRTAAAGLWDGGLPAPSPGRTRGGRPARRRIL